MFIQSLTVYIKGSFTPPGSCDSGVVHCHSIADPRGVGPSSGGGLQSPSGPPGAPTRHRHSGPHLLQHMDRLVLEVLETEALYVQGLDEVIKVRVYLNFFL